jgi:ADP-ribosylglycohydrolase
MLTRDKIAGAVYGCALGDALGRHTEFMKLKEIIRAYGAYGRMSLPRPALFTDDTQMTLAVGRALAGARSHTPREYVRTLTNEFINWRQFDAPRAPGVSCMTAISGLRRCRERKLSWIHGTTTSRGCGANMRVVPTALLPDAEHAVVLTQLQAAITHGDHIAIAAAELTAWAIRYAALGASPVDLPEMLYNRALTQCGVYHWEWLGRLGNRWSGSPYQKMVDAWSHMARVTQRVSATLNLRRTPTDVCGILGGSWIADEAYATGLYFAVRYVTDPVLAISMAARTSGDSDSIACIAGAIAGASAGNRHAWPEIWTHRIERRTELEQLIDQLWDRWA